MTGIEILLGYLVAHASQQAWRRVGASVGRGVDRTLDKGFDAGRDALFRRLRRLVADRPGGPDALAALDDEVIAKGEPSQETRARLTEILQSGAEQDTQFASGLHSVIEDMRTLEGSTAVAVGDRAQALSAERVEVRSESGPAAVFQNIVYTSESRQVHGAPDPRLPGRIRG